MLEITKNAQNAQKIVLLSEIDRPIINQSINQTQKVHKIFHLGTAKPP